MTSQVAFLKKKCVFNLSFRLDRYTMLTKLSSEVFNYDLFYMSSIKNFNFRDFWIISNLG